MGSYRNFWCLLVVFVYTVASVASAVRVPLYPVRSQVNRFSPSQYSPYKIPVFVENNEKEEIQRPKRDHRDYDDDHFHDHDHDNHHRNHHRDHHNNGGVTGPVHTFVKTDKNANYKWGVRHHVGPKYV